MVMLNSRHRRPKREKISVNNLEKFINRFEFPCVHVSELEPLVDGENKINGVRLDGDIYRTDKRFVNSMMSTFGFAESLFDYFSPEELLNRIVERKRDKYLRLCIDHQHKLINGVTLPQKETLPLANVCSILAEDKRLSEITYDPASSSMDAVLKLPDEWNISQDSPYNTFLNFTYPVDQWRTPSISLGMVRLVCTNGLIARKKCFETELIIEKTEGTHLRHLLASFNNRNGFDALRERLETAQNTKASVNEFLGVINLVNRCISDPVNIIDRLHLIAGLPERKYGQVRLDNIRSRHRQELPTQASIMDMVNVLTELATYRVQEHREYIHAYATGLLAKEFDLEELAGNTRPAREFYMEDVLI